MLRGRGQVLDFHLGFRVSFELLVREFGRRREVKGGIKFSGGPIVVLDNGAAVARERKTVVGVVIGAGRIEQAIVR